jgi:SMC interacting uncharacterized protein involved in chromosome segregation
MLHTKFLTRNSSNHSKQEGKKRQQHMASDLICTIAELEKLTAEARSTNQRLEDKLVKKDNALSTADSQVADEKLRANKAEARADVFENKINGLDT